METNSWAVPFNLRALDSERIGLAQCATSTSAPGHRCVCQLGGRSGSGGRWHRQHGGAKWAELAYFTHLLPPVFLTSTSVLNPKPGLKRAPARDVQSRRSGRQPEGAALIPARLMNGDTLIFIIPNWRGRFN